MRVRAERVGSAVFVDLEGPLTVEADTHQLHDLVTSVTQLGPYGVVLNLGDVPLLDCSGIGQLVQLSNQVRESGGTLILVNVDGRQRRLLQILGLLTMFHLLDSRQEATAWCQSAAGTATAPRTSPSSNRLSFDPPAAPADAVYPSMGGGLEPAL
jgi:anti-anti-sigma factor